MLNEQTMTKLYDMKLNGMAEAYAEQRASSSIGELSFEERFSLLVEPQWRWKENRSLAARLTYAGLKQKAAIEDLDFRYSRGLTRAQIDQLATGQWIEHHQNAMVTAPPGCGKTFVACARAHKACRQGHRALYFYAPRRFRALTRAQAGGSLPGGLKRLAQANLPIMDDGGMTKIEERQYCEFLEMLDDCHATGLLRLGQPYGNSRLEVACRRAIPLNACNDRGLKSILATATDRQPPPQSGTSAVSKTIRHTNLRGQDYPRPSPAVSDAERRPSTNE